MNWNHTFEIVIGLSIFTLIILILLSIVGLIVGKAGKLSPEEQDSFGERVAAKMKADAEAKFNKE